MNDFEADQMITRYGTSWYADIDRIDVARVAVAPKTASTSLVQAMIGNVEEAKYNCDGIRERYENAQRDGVFDVEALDTIKNKKLRERWLAAIETQKGDRVRCVAELRHWREYVAWAMEQEKIARGPEVYDDPRLPVERDEVNV